MPAEEDDYIELDVIVPHEIAAKVECCGCLIAIRRGDKAEIRAAAQNVRCLQRLALISQSAIFSGPQVRHAPTQIGAPEFGAPERPQCSRRKSKATTG